MSAKTGAPHGTRNQTTGLSWAWQNDADCRGENLVLFFGPDGERQPERDIRERKAKAMCAHCPVRRACADYAIGRPEKYGTWGAFNEDERASERRRRMRRANDHARLGSATDADDEGMEPVEAAS